MLSLGRYFLQHDWLPTSATSAGRAFPGNLTPNSPTSRWRVIRTG